jgi:hypothetical protein
VTAGKSEMDMRPDQIAPWSSDWAWGLPLILLTVIIHVLGLGLIKRRTDRLIRFIWRHQAFSIASVTLLITLLHGFEVFLWAVVFRFLKAVPDAQTAMLYSLNALTAFGHTDVTLERQWQLMGALESLNGWILFGLSTAYLFALIQRIWSGSATALHVEGSYR